MRIEDGRQKRSLAALGMTKEGCLKASNSSSERKALVEVGPFKAI